MEMEIRIEGRIHTDIVHEHVHMYRQKIDNFTTRVNSVSSPLLHSLCTSFVNKASVE